MAMSILVLSCLIFQSTMLLELAEADAHIDVSTAEIILGFTDSLNINCSFSPTDTTDNNMVSLSTLTLARASSPDGVYKQLAIMTDASTLTQTNESITVSGLFDHATESFLNMRWDRPTEVQAGWYQCMASGYDGLGRVVTRSRRQEITARQPTFQDWGERLKEVETRMPKLEQMVAQLSDRMNEINLLSKDHMIEFAEKLSDNIKNLKQEISALRSLTRSLESKVEKCATGLENVTPGILAERNAHYKQIFDFSLTYNNHTYGIPKEYFSNINESMAMCERYGGYLAIMNNSAELDYMQQHLGTPSYHFRVGKLVISGTDEGHEGKWTLPLTDQPMPYEDWDPQNTKEGDEVNCVYLYYPNWHMFDLPCQRTAPVSHLRYMCEIPVL